MIKKSHEENWRIYLCWQTAYVRNKSISLSSHVFHVINCTFIIIKKNMFVYMTGTRE